MRFMSFRRIAPVLFAGLAGSAFAQGTQVAFGAFSHDPTLPVEVAAETFSVNQSDGTAVFSGGVAISQGDMRIEAGEVRITYAEGEGDATGRVEQLMASGGVTLTSGAETAESREALYTIDTGEIVMTGDVILTQGQNALSAGKLTVNLTSGTGLLEGGVRAILQPGTNP
jgi:lipopolysaccharide export system protein LptA